MITFLFQEQIKEDKATLIKNYSTGPDETVSTELEKVAKVIQKCKVEWNQFILHMNGSTTLVLKLTFSDFGFIFYGVNGRVEVTLWAAISRRCLDNNKNGSNQRHKNSINLF